MNLPSFKKFVGRGVKDPVNVSSTKPYQGVLTKYFGPSSVFYGCNGCAR